MRCNPATGSVGEEVGAHGNRARRWVVDGIDGTISFVLGDPRWSTQIPLFVRRDDKGDAVHARTAGSFPVFRRDPLDLDVTGRTAQRAPPVNSASISSCNAVARISPNDVDRDAGAVQQFGQFG